MNPATNTAGERSFLSACPLKTWLRSRMDEERLSSLCLSRLSVIGRKAGEGERKKIEGLGVLGRSLPAFPRPPSIFLRSLRSRLPTFCPTDREPGTGYSSLAVLNDPKQRTETSAASTDSVCRSLFLATRMAREVFATSKSRELR